MPKLTDIQTPINNMVEAASIPETPIVPGVGATPVIPDMSIESGIGRKESSVRPFNISEYENILGENNVNPNLDLNALNEYRAQSQSGWYLTKNALGQLGTTVLGGTITGIGNILNFFPTTYRAISQIWDDNAKYKWDQAINEGLGSEWIKQGKVIEELGRKAMPIYQTEQAQKGGFAGGMGDATWWASMFPTVGSAAASMIPVIGNLKALQLTGKLMQKLNGVSKIGSGLNTLGRSLQNPYTQQVIGTLYGAHLDSMEEIVRGYDEQFQYALDLGFSEEEARKYASVYASESYNDAWAYGVLFNAIELNSMLRGIKEAPVNSINIERGLHSNIKGLANKGKDFVLDSETSKLNQRIFGANSLQKIKDFASVSLSEGLEEMRVDLALNEGVIAAKKELGIEDETSNLTPLARMGRLVEQASSWDSFIWGAIGGGVMSAGRGAITRVLNGKAQQESETKRATNIINGIQDTAAAIADFDGNMNIQVTEEPVRDEAGNQLMNADGTPKVNRVITDPASSMLVGIMNKISSVNGFKYAIEYFDELSKLSDAQIEEVYGANKRPIIDALRREFMIMRDIHARNMGLIWGNPFDNVLRVQASTDEYLLDYYKRQLDIVDTNLKTFDIEATKLRNKNQETLKSIDSKLHELNVEKIVLEQERDNIKKIIEDYNIKADDKFRKKAVSVLKGKQTKARTKIDKIENQISSIQSEIDVLNNDIAIQGIISTKQPNRKARKLYIFKIKNIKKDIVDLQQKINNANQTIVELKLAINNYEQEIAIHNGEFADIQRHIELFESELDDYNKRIERIDSEIAEQNDKENNNVAEYNEAAKRLRETRNKNNQTYQSLEDVRTQLAMAVMVLEENVNNRDQIMAERAKLLKQVYDAQEKIEEAQEELDKTNKDNDEKTIEEPAKVTTEIETDSNGISYSLDDTGTPNTVEINKEVYSVGSKFNIAESPKTVQKLEVLTDEQSDFSAVMITIKDDKTGKIDTYSAKELGTMDISKFQTPSENNIEKLYNSLYNIQNTIPADAFKDKYFDTIDYLNSELSNNESQLYTSLLLPADDSKLNELRIKIISDFIIWINEYQPSEISNENLEKANKIKQILSDSNIRISNNLKLNQFKDYLWNLYGGDIVGYSEENNINTRNAIESYIDKIAQILNNNYIIENNQLKFRDINVNPVTIRQQINDIIDVSFENLKTKFDTIQYSDFYKKLIYFKNIVLNNIGDSTITFYKTNITYFNDIANRFINKIRNIRQDTESPLHDALVDDDKFGPQTTKIMEFSTSINGLANDFLSTGSIPNLPTRKRIHSLFQAIQPFLVSDIDALNISNTDVITAVRNSNILNLLRNARMIYGILGRYYNFESGSEINDDSTILNSLDILADSIRDFMGDSETKDAYSTNDYRYYISDSMRNALNAINNTIAKLDSREIFSDNHVYDFEDILDAIYQQENGREEVIKYYQPIWYALRYFKNDINVNSIYQMMKRNGVPKEHLDSLKELFDIITNRIASPIQTVDSKYIDSDYNLRENYLNNFFKTHIQNEFATNGFRGLRRLTPEIYNILSDPKYYNSKTRTIKNNITVNDIQFTSEEIFEALQSLKPGQEFDVKYENGYVNINIIVNNKPLLIERIGIEDSENYQGFKLGKSDNEGNVIYDSAFGNENGTSKFIDTIIRKAGNSDTIFNLCKEFYKTYTEAQLKEKQNTEEVKQKLNSILLELDNYGNTNKNEHSEIVNAFINAIQYDTDIESLNPNAFDLNNLDLNKVYYLISPMFYNVRLKNIKDFVRYGLRIKNQYQNLNTKLANDFIQSQRLVSEIREKGSATLVLTGVNKSPITYGNDPSYRANINDEIQRTVTVKGSPAVNIIQKQPDENGLILVSSLTTDTAFNNPIAEDRITSNDRHFQMYAEIKSNDGENGKSYLPLHRGNLSSDVANTDFNKAAMEYVTQTMSDIISDATFTSLPLGKTSGLYSLPDDANNSATKAHNLEIAKKLLPLSEAIIVSYKRGVPGAEWFNISSLYENIDPATGKIKYVKHIDFQTVVRKKNILGNGISYSNRISVEYEKVGDKFIPIKLRLSRKVIPVNRNNAKNKLSKSPFTERQINKLNGTIEKRSKDKNTYAVIDLKSKGITGKSLDELLNDSLFRDLYGNMQRSITTALRGNHYTYGIKTIDGYQAITGKYESQILNWAKDRGIIDKSVSSTFDSMQDFILDTGALTVSAIGIKNNNGKVLTNYTIDSVKPAMFFELKTEVADNPIKNENDISKDFAVKAIESLSKTEYKDEDNWYKKLTEFTDNKVSGLRTLGVIPNYVSDEIANKIVELYDRIYSTGSTKLKLEKIKKKNYDVKAYFSNKADVISINSDIIKNNDFEIDELGLAITHESLHKFLVQDNNDLKLHEELKDVLSPIIENSKDKSVEEFNKLYNSNFNNDEYALLKAYLDVLNKEPKEIVTYALTDKKFADLANRIILDKVDKVKKRKSLWNKIINAILKLVGIDNITDNSLLNQFRNIIINSLDSVTDNRTNPRKSGRATHLPTGKRSEAEGRSEANQSVTPSQTTVTSDLTHSDIETISNVETDDIQSDELRYLFGEGEIVFDDNNFDELNSLDIEIDGNSNIAGRGAGYTPTLVSAENNSKIILNNNENNVSLNGSYLIDFITKYTDGNNNKIC